MKLVTQGISLQDMSKIDLKVKPTHGEINFKRYDLTGIRGEAESGFATVLSHGLPPIKEMIGQGITDINNILIQVLLHLMTNTEDSNVIARHDLDTLRYVQEYSKAALALRGTFTPEGRMRIMEMDQEFIVRNIRPGGAADLLAVTMMLFLLENPDMIFGCCGGGKWSI